MTKAQTDYDAALSEYRNVFNDYTTTSAQYLAKAIGDDEYLEARERIDAASKAMDVAEAALQAEGTEHYAAGN